MKCIFSVCLILLSWNASFSQSVRKQNKELEKELIKQCTRVDSLLKVQSALGNSIWKLSSENAELMDSVMELYNETEETKFQFYKRVNYANDTLIDWNMFYRFETVSLTQLMNYREKLTRQELEMSVLIDEPSSFLTERKRMNATDRYELLKQQLAFFSGLTSNLQSTLMQLQDQYNVKQADQAKLISWKIILEKTKDYCISTLLRIDPKEGWYCGTIEAERLRVSLADFSAEDEKEYEQAPEFPGGIDSLIAYLAHEAENLKMESKPSHPVKVYVKFIVTDNGEIRSPIITKGSNECKECEKKALEIIRDMPRWNPATKGGHPVSFEYRLLVRIN